MYNNVAQFTSNCFNMLSNTLACLIKEITGGNTYLDIEKMAMDAT